MAISLERMVVFVFTHYEEIKKAVAEKRLDPATQKQGGCGHSFVSDPTANKAIRNISDLDMVVVNYGVRDSQIVRNPERWLRVIERTRLYYDKQIQGRLIEMLYKDGASWRDICKELHLRRGTYYTLVNDVISFASGVAIGLGLVE